LFLFQSKNIFEIIDHLGIAPYLLGQDPQGTEIRIMELTRIAGNCKDGDCPTVYRTDRGTVAVQGNRVARTTPEGEAVVEIPAELLVEAARALGR
jgi:hypothetical protein